MRLYAHELNCVAYRTLSPAARTLLVEMRALYRPNMNTIFMSRDEMARRINAGRRVVEKARDQLIERGWIRVVEKGSFKRKNRKATVYMLTNEVSDDREGAVAPKDYMKWRPKEVIDSVSNGERNEPHSGTSRTETSKNVSSELSQRGPQRTPLPSKVSANGALNVPTDIVTRRLCASVFEEIAAFQSDVRAQFLYCTLSLMIMHGELE